MPNIDNKVVSISFETDKFQRGVSTVIAGMDKLRGALRLSGAEVGMGGLTKSLEVNNSHMQALGQNVQVASSKLSMLAVSGGVALAGLATAAVVVGGRITQSLALDPVLQGYKEYEIQLNAVQTILANTQASGAKLKDVNKTLDELNTYADKTIYNFAEMARNVGTFTAAGVDLKTSTSAIKGIANLAALSGSNSQQASTAMYQLSQAIAAGSVKLMDWNSVVNAGMGGTVFQRALAETAVKMGTLDENAVKLTGKMKNVTIAGQAFRNSLSAENGKQPWLTTKVLTETLKQFTGDMSDAELAAQGFSKEQIKAIQLQAKTALNAATQVKTLTALLDTTKEQISSGWAQTWRIIFGDFGEAKTLFTSISNAIGGFVGASANARNSVLNDWKDLGGRTLLLKALRQAFEALKAVLKPIKEAFREIFPKQTGKDLLELTKRFESFTEKLKIGPETAENLKRTFAGFFAILSIGKTILTNVFRIFSTMFGEIAGKGSGGFLNLTGNVGDFFVSLDKALKSSEAFKNFFVTIGKVLAVPIRLFDKLSSAISNLFSEKTSGLGNTFEDLTGKISPFQQAVQSITKVWRAFTGMIKRTAQQLLPGVTNVADLFTEIGDKIAHLFNTANMQNVLTVLNTVLLGGIAVMIKKFFTGGLENALKGVGGGLLKSIIGPFDQLSRLFSVSSSAIQQVGGALTGTLTTMQNNVRAKTLKEIAIAVALLSGSMVAMSLINAKKMGASLSGLTVAFGELVGAMALLNLMGPTAGLVKIPLIAGSMILLAGAVDLLVIAVLALSNLKWEQLAKGLSGTAALLGVLVLAAQPLSAVGPRLAIAAVGVGAIAVAMKILASAINDLGSMRWETLGKGISGVAAALVSVGAASRLFPTGMIAIGLGLLAISGGLKILSDSIASLGNLDWATLARGISAVAAALVVVALAMKLMPKNMIVTAAGLALVSLALQGISSAVAKLGGLSMDAIGRGLAAMAGALIILGLALYGMQNSMGGAVALGVAAVSINILAVALSKLGGMSWGDIIKGMVGVAGTLLIFGAAAALLTPLIPSMLGLGAALLILGGGMLFLGGAIALAGLGIAAIGTGLSAIAVAGPAAIGILIKALSAAAMLIPKYMTAMAMGVLGIVDKLAEVAPKFLSAIVKLLTILLDGIILVAPKLGQALIVVISTALKVIDKLAPQIISTAYKLILMLAKGIRDHIGEFVDVVVDIVVNFVNALARNLDKIITAGANLVVKFIEGIGKYWGRVASAGTTLVIKLAGGVVNSVSRLVSAAGTLIVRFLSKIAGAGSRIITAGATMVIKLISGIASKTTDVVNKAVSIAGKFIRSMATALLKLVDVGANAMIDFINSLADTMRTKTKELRDAMASLGVAIVQGLIDGIDIQDVVDFLKSKLKALPGPLGDAISAVLSAGWTTTLTDIKRIINSGKQTPARAMSELGKYMGKSFVDGLIGSEDDINNALSQLDSTMQDKLNVIRDTISANLDKLNAVQARRPKSKKAKQDKRDDIDKLRKLLKEEADLYDSLEVVQNNYRKKYDDNINKLKTKASELNKITKDIDTAQQSLDSLKSDKLNYAQTIKDAFSTLPDINQELKRPLASYNKTLTARVAAVKKYKETIEELRKLGLDEATYRKLLSDGIVDQNFASELLAGGPDAIAAINKLDSELGDAATGLGDNAAASLYDAGINAAQGILDGLVSRKGDIEKVMRDIARDMVDAIKKSLNIKSPSRVFVKLGQYTTQGLADGLKSSTNVVTNAVGDLAKEAISAMNKSLTQMSTEMLSNIDPTIRPVLDLEQVQRDAVKMADILNVVPITAAASYGQAASISSATKARQETVDQAAGSNVASVVFNQTNTSPEALSEVDIYRQTKNQLALAKSVLLNA